MHGGGWAKPGVRLSTNSFKLQQREFLSCLLKKKWDLNCTIQKISRANQYSIYIKSEYLVKLRKLVLPFLVPSMHYKLGLAKG